MIAALFVEADGPYAGLVDVDLWPEARDARRYAGPFPVVAHPPCKRWGRYWYGGPRSPVRFEKGEDGGCFESALASVRRWGGVLEHPADSAAWKFFGLKRPPRAGGWVSAGWDGGWTCCVDQGYYGHRSSKPTWLFAVGCDRALPMLQWDRKPGGVRFTGRESAAERAATRKRQRRGVLELMSHRERAETPIPFRDLLLTLARSAVVLEAGAP